ncbi:hypothetical protein E8L99_23450 [Phreatobacter aquaticus]|uniref:histidine kinase n=1 Tax=Phreatobacter aquaticus TaxID=2570229 RepID=A0A4D7QR92_9HYPH|nr:ATP-binding protein [Phreatobacter aquaticus]QCK88503.1 hypothetical protein E8L99_23450 [Phreatobacter aquaticus]
MKIDFWKRRLAIALASLLGLAATLVADPARARSSAFVGPNADFAIDIAGQWTIEDMAGPEGATRFIRADGVRAANYGAAHGPQAAMWLRVVVPTDLTTAGGVVVLTVRESRIRTLEVYRHQAGGFDTQTWRLGVPLDTARLATRYPSIALPESAKGETIFIRFHTPSSMRASVWLQNETSYLKTYVFEMMFFGVLFGVLLALLIYFTSAAVASRDPTTGALAFLVLCFGCHIIGDQAFFETFIVPGAVNASRILSITATAFIYAISLYYALQSLRARENFPTFGRALHYCVWFLAAFAIAVAVETTAGGVMLRRLSPIVGLFTISTVLGLVLATATRQPRRAIDYILCWGPAMATGVARLIPDVVPHDGFNPVLINLLYPAFALSLLLAGISAAGDIRRRERALTSAAAENAERLRAFAESASDSFWETNGAGQIVFASGPASSIAGLAVGKSVHSVLEADPGVHLKPGQAVSRAPLQRDDGHSGHRHLRLSAVPIAGGGWRGIVSDVTDEVAEAERSSRQSRMAAIGQMAGGVAHEINNLLHPVINLTRRTSESFGEDDERRRWLDVVRTSGMRAAEIVAALLTSVRPIPDDGRRAPLGDALKEIAEEVRALVPGSTRLETRFELQGGPVVPVTEVFQVVANLVINAVHATRGGSVVLTYGPAGNIAGECLELTVEDDGIGMDQTTLRRASEPFFSTKPQGEGTGLGLSIVQGIASQWGGELKITSALGKGTRVTISLPLSLHNAPGEQVTRQRSVG